MLLPPSDPPPLRELAFAVIDLETTGGSPKSYWDRHERYHEPCEITEVGVVRATGRVIQDRFESLCAIQGPLPAVIQRLTGITLPLLADAPPWEQVALRLSEVLEGRIWVAHHAAFDGSFLKAYLPPRTWKRHRLICTRNLALRLVPEASSRSLASLCELLQLHNRRPHRALADAEVTAELLQRLMDRGEAAGMDSEAFLETGTVPWERL